eukprot:2204795-Amphidinium_carterae.1
MIFHSQATSSSRASSQRIQKVMSEGGMEAPSLRGWVMRKGHRARLSREDDKESQRGRARYSQSVGMAWGGQFRNAAR